jgi:hypothetical protein
VTSARAPSLLAALACVLACGCGKPPPRAALDGWPLEQELDVGACRFRMTSASLFHSTEWHLHIDVHLENLGPEKRRCEIDVRAVTAGGNVLTDAATAGLELEPGASIDLTKSATEANMTGFSGGPAEDAWLYVQLTDGRWPIGTTKKVHATPRRDRPPPT